MKYKRSENETFRKKYPLKSQGYYFFSLKSSQVKPIPGVLARLAVLQLLKFGRAKFIERVI